MKKLITILFATLLSVGVFAQAQFGIKAGLNIAAIGSSDSDWNEMISSKAGIQFGGVATIPFGDVVQLRTGAIYSQKGATVDVLGTDIILAVDYLEVPADFTFMLGDGGFALSAGPYFAFLMSAKAKADGESEDMEDVSAMDLGLNFGASFTIAESMIIDARYGMGLMNLVDDADDDDETMLNGCFSISFAYMFGG
ncbi:MAG TPA: PorT family protein [Flavobacteriales bacterium]|nr:PorT family protein [Flavobacteriales bacterium]HIL66758.1 PorT family protein [Flavobacteriales bacterium]